MQRALESSPMGDVVRQLFPMESLRVMGGKCPFCNQPVDTSAFRDELSRREYGISGLCQTCQDATFGGPEDEE